MVKWDVIVVGAGAAGCLAAECTARKGLKTLIIERKPMEKIGQKTCGDGIGIHHFKKLKLDTPKGEELADIMEGIMVHSPDDQTVFRIASEEYSGFVVNRREFGQRLLRYALDKGAELYDSSNVRDATVTDEAVKLKYRRNGKLEEVTASVIIDASGMNGIVRKKLASLIGVSPTAHISDLEICYREIVKVKEPIPDKFGHIYLNQELSPGGYIWIFNHGENVINVGLGIQMSRKINPKEIYDKFIIKKFNMLKDRKVIHAGGGVVAVRRPFEYLAWNRVMFAGDAAYTVNPIHGGGIGSSMLSGRLAGETAVEAFEKEDFSINTLWSYPVKYMKEYGSKQVGLDIFRLFLQTCTNDELNHGMRQKLIKEEDVLKASLTGEVKLNITDKAMRVLRGLGHLKLLLKLRRAAKYMKEAKKLCATFPKNPSQLHNWLSELNKLYVEYKSNL